MDDTSIPRIPAHPHDIDLMIDVASLTVAASALAARLAEMTAGERIDVTLTGKRLTLSQGDVAAMATDIIDRRNALLDRVGPRAADRVVREIAYGFALMCDAEAILREQGIAESAAPFAAAVGTPLPVVN